MADTTPPTRDPRDTAAEEAARTYAWNWFEYHAGQRQAVFRFYLLLSGATSTGYITTINSAGLHAWSCLFGLLLAVFSFLFWRLDVRSSVLVKSAERYLKFDEDRLAKILNTDDVKLAEKADKPRNKERFRYFYSFKQIYRWLFVLGGIGGIAVFLGGLLHSPIKGALSIALSRICALVTG